MAVRDNLARALLCFLILTLTIGSSQAQIPTLNWSNTYFRSGYDLHPNGLETRGISTGRTQDALIAAWAAPTGGGTGGGMVVNIRTAATIPFTTGVDILTGFVPTSLSNNAPLNSGSDVRVFGKQFETLGLNARYFGGGGAQLSGSLDFEYQARNSTNYTESLGVAPYPYGGFSGANIQQSVRKLAIFYSKAGGSNPSLVLTDTSISPMSMVFGGNLILAAGDDQGGPRTGARASGYLMNANGTATRSFSRAAPNTLVNNVFTSHALMWGAYSGSFNILVDNRKVHDAAHGTFAYGFTLYAFDGVGNQLWQSADRPGNVFQISVGSPTSIYTLSTQAPGQVLSAFGTSGTLIWNRSTTATRLSAYVDQGVVAADSDIDNTGHHHVHFVRYLRLGSIASDQKVAGSPTSDDSIRQLAWVGGSIFLSGQTVFANGAKGIFGAQYDFPSLPAEILSDHPVGYWRLDDVAGSAIAHDRSGNGYDGQVSGAVTFGSAGGTGTSCGTFGGGAISIVDPQGTRFPSSDSITVEIWFMEASRPNYTCDMVGKARDTAEGSWQVYGSVTGSNPIFSDGTWGNPNAGGSATSTTSPVAGTWHQFVGIADSDRGQTKIYIDGQLTGSSTYVPRAIVHNNDPLMIGTMYTYGPYTYFGHLSDVAIFSGPMSADRIQAHWLAGTSH